MKKIRKRITELTEEEKEKTRKIWREEKKRQKMKKINNENRNDAPSTSKPNKIEAPSFKNQYLKVRRMYRRALFRASEHYLVSDHCKPKTKQFEKNFIEKRLLKKKKFMTCKWKYEQIN